MIKRIVFPVIGSIVLTLMMASMALASTANPATPWDIYYDFAYGGEPLDGISDDSGVVSDKYPYTDAEYQAYLNDSEVQQYVDNLTDDLDPIIDRDTFPFTGFQLMIAGIVVVALIGGGVALRLLSRPHKT
jgi:hypothetical protein